MDSRVGHHYVQGMRKILLLSIPVLGAALGALLVSACGSSGSTNGNNPGGGGGDGGGVDGASPSGEGGTHPTGPGSGSDGGLPDGAAPPQGTHLVTSNSLVLDGVTSDDFAIYTDTSSHGVFAIALAAGSTPTSLGTTDSQNDVYVSGKIVFIGTSSTQGVGAVSVWKSGATQASSLGATTAQGFFSTSSDDAQVLYLDNIDATGSTGDISVAAPDGAGKKVLVAGVDLTQNACQPAFQFDGTYAIAAYCLPAGDAGAADAGGGDAGANANVATVMSYAGPSWSGVLLSDAAQPNLVTDTQGKTVLLNTAAGLVAYPAAGGAQTLIDATATAQALLTADGSHVVYTTTTNGLMRAATTSPASPVALAPAAFARLYALSPDEKLVIGALASAGSKHDLFVASATTAGTPTPIVTTPTTNLVGDFFTADSSRVLFYANVASAGGGAPRAGDLSVVPVAGGAATAVTTGVFGDLATTGTKVILSDGYSTFGNGLGDILAYDTAQSAAPTLLVTQADAQYFLSSKKDKLVYTYDFRPGTMAGLWVMSTP